MAGTHAASGLVDRLVWLAIPWSGSSSLFAPDPPNAIDANASNAETPNSGRFRAIARPCIVAMPTRNPVNDPGPIPTASDVDLGQCDALALEHRRKLTRQSRRLRT